MSEGSGLTKGDSGVQSEPYLFPRSGYFLWDNSGLYNRGSGGFYWSLHTHNKANSRYLGFGGSSFGPRDGYSKGYGFAVLWGGESSDLLA